jgi:hypothetical protein
LNQEIKDKIKAIDKLKKELVAESSKVLDTVFVGLFKEHPQLKKIQWTQYTPYFNDGEPCEFQVYGEYLDLEYLDELGELVELEGFHIYDYLSAAGVRHTNKYDWDEWLVEVDSILSDLFSSIPSEVFKEVYGDHSEVTVTAEGVTVEEYDHD